MPREILPSSFACDCGHRSHFAERTVREAKARSYKRPIRLGDSGPNEHVIVFHHGQMVDIICPWADETPMSHDVMSTTSHDATSASHDATNALHARDEAAQRNEQHWERMVEERCGYTVPWLTLDRGALQAYARGELDPVSSELTTMTPRELLLDIAGKDVLCLACGGGQQSAVFGLLGAQVTVVELAQGQLAADRTAAAKYGYDIQLIHADMRDLSMLPDASFDLVYNTALCYVPDIHQVYSEAARVLRPGGLYRTDFWQPAVHFVQWNGQGYQIAKPYHEHVERRQDGAIEFRHYMDDIFNGLLDVGLSIQRVKDLSRDEKPDTEAVPGTWRHESAHVGGAFVIVARKGTESNH